MRRIVLTLTLLSLAFAPAPLPRRDRQTAAQKRQRGLAECTRRLDELGVTWRLQQRGESLSVDFAVCHPDGDSKMGGEIPAHEGDVAGAMRRVVVRVEEFLGHRPREKP